jgi:hypothetical protein
MQQQTWQVRKKNERLCLTSHPSTIPNASNSDFVKVEDAVAYPAADFPFS